MKKIGARTWAAFILIGLVGQFAWTVENMYLNVYLYNTISTDPTYIASMVSASAITATLTTLVMGALSDRVGKRKAFVVAGYLLWGVSVIAFGYITPETMERLFPGSTAAAAAAIGVVAMDCLMTFFGSTANDAAFNAYITDVTDESNRGKAESVLAILPLISMLVIFGLFDSLTQQGRWQQFFLIFGVMVIAAGVAAIFLLKDPELPERQGSYFKNIVYGFRPSVVKALPELYISLAALLVFSVAVQIFFPYLIIYLQMYLGFDNYAIILGVVLLVASLFSVLSGSYIDKIGKMRIIFPASAFMLLGLILMYFARSFGFTIFAGIVMMGGYMLVLAIISAIIRDHTPEGKAGHFQGIRMIFSVMLPMIIGPFIGSFVIKGSGETYVELGTVKTVPTPAIFLAAAVVLLLVAVPVATLRKREEKK